MEMISRRDFFLGAIASSALALDFVGVVRCGSVGLTIEQVQSWFDLTASKR
jgi:hypothetical protein